MCSLSRKKHAGGLKGRGLEKRAKTLTMSVFGEPIHFYFKIAAESAGYINVHNVEV